MLQGALADIREAGATLVAISPQTSDQLPTLAERRAIEYPVLPDAGNAVAKHDGLVFTPAEAVTAQRASWGSRSTRATGIGPRRWPPQRRPSSGPTGRSASRLPLATTAGQAEWSLGDVTLVTTGPGPSAVARSLGSCRGLCALASNGAEATPLWR